MNGVEVYYDDDNGYKLGLFRIWSVWNSSSGIYTLGIDERG